MGKGVLCPFLGSEVKGHLPAIPHTGSATHPAGAPFRGVSFRSSRERLPTHSPSAHRAVHIDLFWVINCFKNPVKATSSHPSKWICSSTHNVLPPILGGSYLPFLNKYTTHPLTDTNSFFRPEFHQVLGDLYPAPSSTSWGAV